MATESPIDESPDDVVDISLLDGLQDYMIEAEQVKVTSLMTSGDCAKLASAATILSGFADLLTSGVPPAARTDAHRASIKALEETSYTNNVAVRKALLDGNEELVESIRRKENVASKEKRLHPLPARMPRYALIDAFDPKKGDKKGGILGLIGFPTFIPVLGKGLLSRRKKPTLTFVDDEWDGSLGDAFCKFTIPQGKNTVKKTPVENIGVANILSAAPDGAKTVVMSGGPHRRVVVKQTRGDAGRQGIRRGDVVTHVNGQPFCGTAQDLNDFLSNFKQQQQQDSGSSTTNDNDKKLGLVVNADLSVAEALHLRSLI